MNPTILFSAATASYAANCALGIGVATGRANTGNVRWVHHALYVCTVALTGAATSSLTWSSNRAGWFLLPAAVPLALIPYAASRSRRHIVVALTAAPFFLASLVKAWR